jgi:hypothetical protein
VLGNDIDTFHNHSFLSRNDFLDDAFLAFIIASDNFYFIAFADIQL